MGKKSLDDLRKELISSLQGEIDYDRVLKLSSEIARKDPDYVRFSIDAGHINRLGRELVARQETAVSELVKNAYDADATLVELTFQNTFAAGGTLTIDDDGLGMNRDQLIDGFMRLSSTDKIHNPVSPLYKRQRAGRKGIGRFAAQRLGQKLIVTTQTEKAKKALSIQIDWGRFQGDIDLATISSRIDTVKKTKPTGTTLRIEGLSDAWPESDIIRVYRYLADLIQPFPLSKINRSSDIDPGFQVDLYRGVGSELVAVANVEQMVYDYALAEINGSVDRNGRGSWTLKSSLIETSPKKEAIGKERNKLDAPYGSLRNVHLKAYYYIYNPGFIPRAQRALIRELAEERGGIRVYRNGFRVLPYGERLVDWLELDASSGRRLILPPHANINFLGFVEISDPQGEMFEETASREGLLENDAFRELVDFTSRVLKSVALRIAEARERKRTAGQKEGSWTRRPSERIKDALGALNESAQNSGQTKQPVSADTVRQIALEIEEALEEEEEIKQSLIQDIGMLRVLASLGLTIGEFTHEIRNGFPPIVADAKSLAKLHPTGKPHEIAESLLKNLDTFRVYNSYFGKAVQDNVHRETKPQELGVVLRDFMKTVKSASDRYAIDIPDPAIKDYDLFTCPMHPSEWVSILFNFFTNSRKAIKRAKRKGKILITAGREKDRVYLEFADNGDGIAPENESRIFDAFFTTTSPGSPYSDDQDEILGTGLGLKIVKDIITSYNGNIELVAPPVGFNICFRVELPRASDEEIREYGY